MVTVGPFTSFMAGVTAVVLIELVAQVLVALTTLEAASAVSLLVELIIEAAVFEQKVAVMEAGVAPIAFEAMAALSLPIKLMVSVAEFKPKAVVVPTTLEAVVTLSSLIVLMVMTVGFEPKASVVGAAKIVAPVKLRAISAVATPTKQSPAVAAFTKQVPRFKLRFLSYSSLTSLL